MVLDRLRILGRTDEAPDISRMPHDGEPATFPELLEFCRKAWGDKIAFQEKHRREWRRYSHNDMYRRSYELAAGFAALGVQPGDRVVMILENSYDWICAYYGVVLAGGVGVPIYYDLKPSEIAEMVRHADPNVAVVSGKVLPKIESAVGGLKTLIVVGEDKRPRESAPSGLSRTEQPVTMTLDDVIARGTAESRARVVAHVVQPDDLASIVFTSGTSGGQKGVMLTHRNFMANLAQIRRSIPFGERDRLVIVLPLHHAFPFTVTVAVAPAVGGEVTFENDLRRIRDRMAEVKPTLFLGVPALFEVMYRNILVSIEAQGKLENFEKGLRIVEATKQRTGINIGRIVFRELHKRLGGSLRFMVSGGAALNPQVTRDFAALGVCIIQGWGLSEAAPVLSAMRWNPRKFYMSNYYEDRVGSIGQALDGVEVGLIDVPEKELYVHLHGEGELVAKGDNVTPGYWRSIEASEEIKVGEWLRTGDIGRIDEDGTIWLTGRSKFVIVLDSGEKVHPDEVEEKLELSPAVQDIVVQGRKLRGKTQIVAVVYPNREGVLAGLGDTPPTEDAVREIVSDGIREQERDVASFKRIVEFMLTDEPLPRTPIRKIMRGHIRDSYGFDVERWAQTWGELQDANAVPAGEGEAEPGELATA
jgi:long-chain acyl-CoA synthetase